MSCEKFELYQDEFRMFHGELQNSLQNKLPKLSGEEKKKEIRHIEKLIEDVEIQLMGMSEEGQNAPGVHRSRLLGQMRDYKTQLEKSKKDFARIKSNSEGSLFNSKDDLLSRQADDAKRSHQNQMIEGLESSNRGKQSVQRSQRIAAETDEVGVGIINDLDDQREKLIRSRDKLKDTQADLGRSRRILNSMGIRMATNKLLLVVIIIVELAILSAVVYLRFFNEKK